MSMFFQRLQSLGRRFRRDEEGNGTIEFVLVFPLVFGLFVSTFEAGIFSTRHVMLEHGLDETVRDVRIGRVSNPDHDTLKAAICESAAIIPNCLNELKLEMQIRNPFNWVAMSPDADCVNREEEGDPAVINTGGNNQLMILRACALFDPVFPTTGLGKAIVEESGKPYYALVATSSFVMEPFQ